MEKKTNDSDQLLLHLRNNKKGIIGRGTYGIIYSVSPEKCIKIFSNENIYSMIREFYIMKLLKPMEGISNFDKITKTKYFNLNINIKNSKYCFLMDKYDQTLYLWLNNKRKLTERIEIIKKIILVFSKIHSMNIIHSDIKLENIMLKNNDIFIIDWSLSGPKNYILSEYTTQIYKSNLCDKSFSHDIYSLGILFIEIIRKIPFLNKDYNFNFFNDTIETLKITSEFKKLIISMIDEEPDKRPSIYQICEFFEIEFEKNQILKEEFIFNKKLNVEIPKKLQIIFESEPLLRYQIYLIFGSLYDFKIWKKYINKFDIDKINKTFDLL
jgi:serine/threonine protein kinase